jgi:hypothetical protein
MGWLQKFVFLQHAANPPICVLRDSDSCEAGFRKLWGSPHEREAEWKREEHKLKKEEQEKKHAAIMQELTLREDRTKQDHATFGIVKTRQDADNKIEVNKMIVAGYISRDEGDRLLGVHRVMFRVSMSKILEKIWLGSNITIKKDLPKNYAQLFYEAYTKQKDEFFSSKPSGDFTNDGQQPPQNLKWYDADLISIWKYAEKLRNDEATKNAKEIRFCSVMSHRLTVRARL